VPADLGGNGFEPLAEEVDFDHDAAEGMSLSITESMVFDDGAQFKGADTGWLWQLMRA
jgi:hypothetical protein